jgi:hypothetical protein
MEPKGSLPHSQEPASLVPGSVCMIRNTFIFLRWEVVNTSPKHLSGGPPLVGCPPLFIQYIRSYPLYPEAVPPSATRGHASRGDTKISTLMQHSGC